MISILVDDVWSSLQEHNAYTVVLVGPTFVRLKSVDNENLVVTLDKARLYEWFYRDIPVSPSAEAA